MRSRGPVVLCGVAALALGGAASAAGASLPTAAGVLASDGRRTVAYPSGDGTAVTVHDTTTGRTTTTTVPGAVAGNRTATVLGVVGGRAVVRVADAPAGPATVAGDALVAVGPDGPARRLCGPGPDDDGTPLPGCPSAGRPPGAGAPGFAAGGTATAVGDRWIRITSPGTHGSTTAVRWALDPAGRLAWTAPGAGELERIGRVGLYQDLDARRIAPAAPFGLRVRPAANRGRETGITFVVRRPSDERNGRLRLLGGAAATGSPQGGALGACVRRGRTAVVVDRASRRVWQRRVGALAGTGERQVACAGSVVVTRGRGGRVDTTLRWPTASRPRGWRTVGILRPGRTVAVPTR